MRGSSLVFGLSLVAIAPSVLAQSSSSAAGAQSPTTGSSSGATPTAGGDARAAFEEGVSALDEGRFADAVASFETSYRLRPVPAVLYNLGFALRGLGRNLAAIAMLERYLANAGPTPDAERTESARAEIARLRATLSTLVIRPSPESATLLVDGRAQDAGTGPREVVLDPGAHAIELSADGYRPARRELELPSGGRVVLDVALQSLEGRARLRVEPSLAGAAVFIDGRREGVGVIERPATPGMHHVEIRADGYVPVVRDVRVGAMGLVRVDATLVRPSTRGLPGWVVPVAVGGTAVVATGVVLLVYFLTAPGGLQPGNWGIAPSP